MTTFNKLFSQVTRLAGTDIKPLGAKLGKLMEEVGELAECVNIHQGFILHKEMKEPLVGEVADVVQNAIAILVDATPELTDKQRLELFLTFFERKNRKWEMVQQSDNSRQSAARYTDPAVYDITGRVHKLIAEQLGVGMRDISDSAQLVRDFGADSLDLVELCMAVEDEFEIEIPDSDAEQARTVGDVVTYVKNYFNATEQIGLDEEPSTQEAEAVDPAADYTERTGRHLSLEERMQERSLNKGNDL